MTLLDEIVEKTVDSYRVVFAVTSVVAVVLTIAQQNWIGLLVLGPLLAVVYFLGLHVVGWVLGELVDRSLIIKDIQHRRILEINKRLEDGTLEAGSEELEKMMKHAGLRPLSIITVHGPVFGKHADTDLHEWVDAKEGSEGEVLRYAYVGQAEFDQDGTVNTPSEENDYIVLNGYLYEHAKS